MAHTTGKWGVWKPEIDAFIQDEQDKMPKSQYEEVFTVSPTNRLQYNENTFSGYNPMQEVGELGDAVEDETLNGFLTSYNRRVYRKSAVFSSDFMETALDKEVENKARDFARVTEYSRNLHVFSVLRRAFDTGVTYGDGQPLASLNHPYYEGSGTYANTYLDGVQLPPNYYNALALQDVLYSMTSGTGNLITPGAQGKNKILFGSHKNREKLYQVAGVEGPDTQPGTADRSGNYIRKGDKFDVLIIDWLSYEAAKQAGETGSVTKSSANNYWDTMWGIMDVDMCKRYFKIFEAEGYPMYDDEITKKNQALNKYAYDKYAYGVTSPLGLVISKGDNSTYSG